MENQTVEKIAKYIVTPLIKIGRVPFVHSLFFRALFLIFHNFCCSVICAVG